MTVASPASSVPSPATLIAHFEAIARAHHSNYDPSHDYHHITRVVSFSLLLSRSLPSPVDSLVIHLSALAHDLIDKKYLPPGSTLTAAEHLAPHWKGFEEIISAEQRALVERIVDNVSYSKEVKRIKNGEETEWHRSCRELHCVQDADKLDAIGAFGILRCAAYSGATLVPLHTPPSTNTSPTPTSAPAKSSAIDHFHEKLFNLEGMMKTEKGREMARKRTERMSEFVEWVGEEWEDVEAGLKVGGGAELN
ncbi:hypothetical protein BCR35DRAFT_292314 [Leucosporidium creatinivorum]|uniref:HD domain-containing protein n=1 Tax=Leucosporidium creatinivorum TaxID=106004 RepID=A0A1Y2F074_9BASI|nr:hypothetical protein BCR35DRAFT_292314 [Leucosporidium creatinivorum]